MKSIYVLAISLVVVSCNSNTFGGGTGTKPVNNPAPAQKPPAQTQSQNQTPVAQPTQQPPVVQTPVTPPVVVQQPVVVPPQPVVQPPVIQPSGPVTTTPVTQVQTPPPVSQSVAQLPPVSGAMVRVPIIGIINMDSKYQITNEGYRVSIEDNSGKVLASGPLNIQSVMDGEAFDAQGSAYGKPYLLAVQPKYLAPEVQSGQVQGAQKAKVSICMPSDLNQAYDQPIQCRDLNKFVGHSNGSNTFVRLAADVQVQKDQVGVSAIYNAQSKGNCGTSKIPCASVMHPIYGFAPESGAFSNDNASPLVLDLNKNGKIDLLSAWRKHGPVSFDIVGDGEQVRMGWVSANDGVLALDINKNGKIDSGRELFGENSERAQKDSKSTRFNNGFSALAQYDTNADGVIDAKDKIFGDLLVWQDRNSDGVSQVGELKSLDKANIKSINLKYENVTSTSNPNMVAGNEVKLMGSYTAADGKTHKMADVWFEMRLQRTLSQIMGNK